MDGMVWWMVTSTQSNGKNEHHQIIRAVNESDAREAHRAKLGPRRIITKIERR